MTPLWHLKNTLLAKTNTIERILKAGVLACQMLNLRSNHPGPGLVRSVLRARGHGSQSRYKQYSTSQHSQATADHHKLTNLVAEHHNRQGKPTKYCADYQPTDYDH
jgi:hypothetical protein